jgi:predicted ATP-grasp superfamily ATP-dependent carboligase
VADYYGTLAAVRSLGRAGVPVTLAESRLLPPARWSRYVTRRVDCPPAEQVEAFLAWLLEFGERNPGHVLYATTDDLAWLFARHADALGRVFRMVQPPLTTLYTLLNKKLLGAACREAGLDTPDTWYPTSDADVERLAREARFPLLIKPQTQILFGVHSKGARAERPEELVPAYQAFMAENAYLPQLLAFDPAAAHPMLQAYYPEAAESIYSLSGFVDGGGELVAVRGAVKVLQRPRRLGVGMCFEDAPVDAALAERLLALCRKVGYHGVFEAEFIRTGGRSLLIDFNPRYYGQMGFDVARGVDLPCMVHAAATGDAAWLAGLVEQAQATGGQGRGVYHHRFMLELVLTLQGMSGALSRSEVERWRGWLQTHAPHATDAVADRQDWKPWAVEVGRLLFLYARHPRSTLRSLVFDR